MGFSLLFSSATLPRGVVAQARPVEQAVPVIPSHAVTVTAYNAVPGQTDDTPLETASGAYSNPEVVAARSGNLAEAMPFGTIIELDGSTISSGGTCGFKAVSSRIGYRVIADTMSARYSDRIDVLFDAEADHERADGSTMNAANVLGVCKGVTARVVGHVDINRIPKTQAGLAALVEKGSSETLAVK